MDTRTGQITRFDTELARLREKLRDEGFEKHFVPIANAKPGQIRAKKVGRNGPCPCGSGKKFKKCCMGRAASASERRRVADEMRASSARLEAAKEEGEREREGN